MPKPPPIIPRPIGDAMVTPAVIRANAATPAIMTAFFFILYSPFIFNYRGLFRFQL